MQDMFGASSPEAQGSLSVYIVGGMIGTIYFGFMASMAAAMNRAGVDAQLGDEGQDGHAHQTGGGLHLFVIQNFEDAGSHHLSFFAKTSHMACFALGISAIFLLVPPNLTYEEATSAVKARRTWSSRSSRPPAGGTTG